MKRAPQELLISYDRLVQAVCLLFPRFFRLGGNCPRRFARPLHEVSEYCQELLVSNHCFPIRYRGRRRGGGRAEVRVRLRVWLREQLRMGQHAWLPAQSSFPAEIRLSAPATLPPQVRCPSGCWAGLHPRGQLRFDSLGDGVGLGFIQLACPKTKFEPW